MFSSKSIGHTKMWNLAAIQFFCRVSLNFDLGNVAYFNKTNSEGAAEIKKCFQSVLNNHTGEHEMPQEFRDMCTDNYTDNFPDLTIDNAFEYAYSTHATNVSTNA